MTIKANRLAGNEAGSDGDERPGLAVSHCQHIIGQNGRQVPHGTFVVSKGGKLLSLVGEVCIFRSQALAYRYGLAHLFPPFLVLAVTEAHRRRIGADWLLIRERRS